VSNDPDRPEERDRRRANGEGGIRWDRIKRRWIATITIGWTEVDDGHGGTKRRQIRKSVTGPTKRAVAATLRDWQSSLDDGLPIADQRITVGELLDIWLHDVLPGTVSRVTEGQYRDVVRLYLKPRLGERRVRDLRPSDVTRMLRDMEHPTEERPNGYSQNSRRLARSVLRRALRWAEVEGIVPRNVAALSNPVRVERPEGRTMTPDQARVFLEAIASDRLEALYLVALSLGLRVSELLAIGWDDLDLEPAHGTRPTITIRRGLKRIRGHGLVIDGVKTKTSRRTIHLPDVAADSLRAHRRRQLAERLAYAEEWPPRPLGVDLVFRTVTGTALDPSNVAHSLTAITKAAGLGHWHPHELRHSAASLLLAQGVPLKVVSDILGHSSINVTADIYAHILAPAKDDAAAAMDRALTTR
jgi:integrase